MNAPQRKPKAEPSQRFWRVFNMMVGPARAAKGPFPDRTMGTIAQADRDSIAAGLKLGETP